MFRTYVMPAIAGAFLLGTATAGLALTGEYDNMCTMGLALGKEVKTDCSINARIEGKTYCFGNEEAKTMFMKDPKGNLARADAYHSKRQAMPQGSLTPGQDLRKELEQGGDIPSDLAPH